MRRQITSTVARAAAGLVCTTAIVVGVAWAEGPSFDCSAVEPGSIEVLICDDAELSAIDRTMAEVYAAASAKAVNEHPPVLEVEQRGWIKGRDECWKADDKRACVENEYRTRIVELQIKSGQLMVPDPVGYLCEGAEGTRVVATFYQETDPPSAVITVGDDQVIAFVAPSGSGAKYTAPNMEFWEHQGEAKIDWYGTQYTCRAQ